MSKYLYHFIKASKFRISAGCSYLFSNFQSQLNKFDLLLNFVWKVTANSCYHCPHVCKTMINFKFYSFLSTAIFEKTWKNFKQHGKNEFVEVDNCQSIFQLFKLCALWVMIWSAYDRIINYIGKCTFSSNFGRFHVIFLVFFVAVRVCVNICTVLYQPEKFI